MSDRPGNARGRAATLVGVVLPRAVLLLALCGAGLWVAGNRSELTATLGSMGVGRVLAAAVLGCAGVVVTAEVWRCSVVAVAGSAPSGLSHRIFWVSQAGKYVPGAVWPFVVQGLAAGRMGIRPRQVLTGGTVFLGVHALSGLLLASLGLAVVTPAPGIRYAVWATTALVGLVLGSGAWRHLPRLLGRPPLTRLRRGPLLRSFGWMCLAWLAYGGSTAILLDAVTDGSAVASLSSGTAASAIGWLVGLLVVFAPAGAGAREVAMIWALGPALASGEVVAVVLVTRLILVVADLGLACTGLGTLRDLRRASPTMPAAQPAAAT